ncbi:MAG: Clavaminate synthase-like protein [Piptocephalis tieghemiana]|nr:MAG: Clavaminate synthase-like protein [Piptocephalis tieghemiana]
MTLTDYSSSPDLEKTPQGVVILDYADLSSQKDLTQHIQEGLGNSPRALGILLVRQVPGLQAAREKALIKSLEHARLSPEHQEETAHPQSNYLTGWSLGKEWVNQKPDISKGSFYANPLQTAPIQTTEEQRARFPVYLHDNRWPRPELISGFQEAFCDLGRLIHSVGLDLARHCDSYIAQHIPKEARVNLVEALQGSATTKGRLLHYYSLGENACSGKQEEEEEEDSWCGWHVDHSFLTGLTSPRYTRGEEEEEVKAAELDAPSLRIRDRSGHLHPISIPQDCLAFQLGQALELASQGHLLATYHCVRRPSDPSLSRDTFALFLQPPLDSLVLQRDNPNKKDFGLFSPSSTMTFGEYTEEVVGRHHIKSHLLEKDGE